MRTLLIRMAVVVAGAAATIAAVPATAHATGNPRITVDDVSGYEGYVICSDGFNDPPCGTVANNQLRLYIHLSQTQNRDVTVGWQLVDGTALYGSDYTGPTTGSLTIARGAYSNSFTIPLVYDGFNESSEGFTVHLTSSSIPANISDLGNETILDGTQIPADCTVANPSSGVITLSCTGRPAGQQWQLETICWPFGKLIFHFGNTVTGNGTSTVDCGGAPIDNPIFHLV
jgi:Calx-beta domain-containing protein